MGILNSYDNTEELLRDFPVINPTPVATPMEKQIQNRLLTGFENWNRGTEAWMQWGNILYTPDSLYNVHGVHLTLREYQLTSSLSFNARKLMMGNFNKMLICGDWCAIRYDITSTDAKTGKVSPGSVMEFVRFRDYGPELGTRVVEGWAGTRGADYENLLRFLSGEEKQAQIRQMEKIAETVIPDTKDLVLKYPVKNPTPDRSEHAQEIRTATLREFDAYNQGFAAWGEEAGRFFSPNLAFHAKGEALSLEDIKASVQQDTAENKTRRLYFDSMLISGSWAAVHFRTCRRDQKSGSKEAADEMKFLHFEEAEGSLRVTECWNK